MDAVGELPQLEVSRHDDEELKKLEKERDDILMDAGRSESRIFLDLERQKKRRLKIAKDYRDLQLKDLYDRFRAEVQQATDEFVRGKRQLQCAMLQLSADRRHRMESVLKRSAALAIVPSLSKRRRRHRGTVTDSLRGKNTNQKTDSFIASLERQGVVRVALTPDEVNTDLEVMLRHLEFPRLNGPTPDNALQRHTDDTPVPGDNIHSSKGTLHYHDITCEKGDRVSIFSSNRSKPAVKYVGIVLSVNPKEVTIRTEDASTQRVPVAHLSNGRLLLKKSADAAVPKVE